MLPLKNKTVLITRSKSQATDFISQLTALGATTITLPLIKTTPIQNNELTKIHTDFDWIVFTSENAVIYFFEVLQKSKIHSKIAAVGSKTAECLAKKGINIDFIPSIFTAAQLALELPIKQDEKVLIPRSDLAKNDIVEILEKRNCIVHPISIYKNDAITHSPAEIKNILNQNVDYITFASGSTIKSFIGINFPLKNEKIICIGPSTAKIATEQGIQITALANPHTIEGMIQAIIEN